MYIAILDLLLSRLWVATVNALRSKSSRSSGSLTPPVVRVAHSTKYTEEDIVCKPTLVLACRREVFRLVAAPKDKTYFKNFNSFQPWRKYSSAALITSALALAF